MTSTIILEVTIFLIVGIWFLKAHLDERAAYEIDEHEKNYV